VFPGFGGQKFIPESLSKVQALTEYRYKQGLDFLISIDGGICRENSALCAKAGVDILVAGSAIYGAENPRQYISDMRERRKVGKSEGRKV